MTIYLIRHGHAEDRMVWHGPDIERPLTKKGTLRAAKAFSNFFSKYKKPEIVITSEAARAKGTADILHSMCQAELFVRECLNPGADTGDYLSVLQECEDGGIIAVIGHEPDMSEFISEYLTEGTLCQTFKKGSIAHIENRCLVNLIQQKVLL